MISRTGAFSVMTFRAKHILEITAGSYEYCRKKICKNTSMGFYLSALPKMHTYPKPLSTRKIHRDTCAHTLENHTHT